MAPRRNLASAPGIRMGSIEQSLGISFEDKKLLRLALAHSSFSNENPDWLPQSNERLEFLGDAVIGSVVAQELYTRHPNWSEGELTQARAALISGDSLAMIAGQLHLGDHIYVGKGEEASGGRRNDSNLADALEAVVGALFLDQGYAAAHTFIVAQLGDELESSRCPELTKSPKATLQEAVQARGFPPPTYEIVLVTGEEHAREFTAEAFVSGAAMGRGTGSSKSRAEEIAASEALKSMNFE